MEEETQKPNQVYFVCMCFTWLILSGVMFRHRPSQIVRSEHADQPLDSLSNSQVRNFMYASHHNTITIMLMDYFTCSKIKLFQLHNEQLVWPRLRNACISFAFDSLNQSNNSDDILYFSYWQQIPLNIPKPTIISTILAFLLMYNRVFYYFSQFPLESKLVMHILSNFFDQ